jgi:hypothetical protein
MMALVQKCRIRKRPRRESSDGISIEEISPDDMGYDGDVEVLRPDQYEEPDSDLEDDHALRRLWPDTDDELASRLRRLSCERESGGNLGRGRKRVSAEMDDEEDNLSPRHTEIEVSEIVEDQPAGPPSKRRRKKTPLGHRVVKKQAHGAWTDSSDKSDDGALESSNSHSTPDARHTPSATPLRREESHADLDAMEIG